MLEAEEEQAQVFSSGLHFEPGPTQQLFAFGRTYAFFPQRAKSLCMQPALNLKNLQALNCRRSFV